MGDRRDHRKGVLEKPFYFRNTLCMRDLPNLRMIESRWRYLRYFGHVVMESTIADDENTHINTIESQLDLPKFDSTCLSTQYGVLKYVHDLSVTSNPRSTPS